MLRNVFMENLLRLNLEISEDFNRFQPIKKQNQENITMQSKSNKILKQID